MSDRANPKPAGLVRIAFELAEPSWHGFTRERVWAEQVADGRYRLRNSAFYAHGVSFEDIVFAKPSEEGTFSFSGASIRGGHSTYRLFVKHDIKSKEFNMHWQLLEKLGCSFEQATEHFLSIDVPPKADIHQVYALLQAGESAAAWEFEEGHCGHPVVQPH